MAVLVNVLYVVVISKGKILKNTALGNACTFSKQSGLGNLKVYFVIDIGLLRARTRDGYIVFKHVELLH